MAAAAVRTARASCSLRLAVPGSGGNDDDGADDDEEEATSTSTIPFECAIAKDYGTAEAEVGGEGEAWAAAAVAGHGDLFYEMAGAESAVPIGVTRGSPFPL